jgi:endonuclease III-like uncharacterized protein
VEKSCTTTDQFGTRIPPVWLLRKKKSRRFKSQTITFQTRDEKKIISLFTNNYFPLLRVQLFIYQSLHSLPEIYPKRFYYNKEEFKGTYAKVDL